MRTRIELAYDYASPWSFLACATVRAERQFKDTMLRAAKHHPAPTGRGLVQAAMIRRHLDGVLAYFTHRITNSANEALNSTIQMLKKRSFGFRSFKNFRTAALFRCGGLQLRS